ncbi:GNAT family N-acetyltransferase [Streptomyces montanisoli]|uniref:GNAT family N-acetyltransferase n=1 Tax=Streptomyces montanisoli TaxID=2798581 RepID=A0A940MJB4_9ACTN|nr:GNAT family N-acetyltransferase [Streptomyces montanisoli]MBP0460752.1 GNAT family N-acetyltransferase [Streptomyces montanisoli]
MEITGGGRLVVRITPSDLGKRVSVRRLTGGSDGAPEFTDTVGVLTSWNDGVMLITRRTGEVVTLDDSTLVAGKVVPDAPARRRGPSATRAELIEAGARAWQPVESERLGTWRLRAAAGFTRRANSALATGDPGLPLAEALDGVRRWYGARGLTPYVQLQAASPDVEERLGAEIASLGWRPEGATEVWTGSLARVGDLAADTGRVVLGRSPDGEWLRRYHRAGGGAGEHVLHVVRSGPSTWFATVPGDADGDGDDGDSGDGPAAIGRCVADGRWAGFMAVEVGPAHRRKGLARAVMAALARRALDEGASAAWLQVEEDNAAARALYTGMGFTAHHGYRYFRDTSGGTA